MNLTACSTVRRGAASRALSFEVLTPLGDDYDKLHAAKCILRSAEGHGRAIVRLAEGQRLDIELALYLQIEKYIVSPKADQATIAQTHPCRPQRRKP